MFAILDTLRLDHLLIVAPGNNSYPVHERISVVSVFDIPNLDNRVEETASG